MRRGLSTQELLPHDQKHRWMYWQQPPGSAEELWSSVDFKNIIKEQNYMDKNYYLFF